MSINLAMLCYLAAGVLFILALRGLSSPETSRRGNILGMIGMVLAVATTLFLFTSTSLTTWLAIGGVTILGAIIGGGIAQKISMTAMPQLVAAFHSLVGLSAVAVAWAAFISPTEFGVAEGNHVKPLSLVEMSIGVVIGAITFSGSLIAFLKLQGLMRGAPVLIPFRHVINIVLALLLLLGVVLLSINTDYQTVTLFFAITLVAFLAGFLLIIPIGGADMPVVISMLNSYSGWAAAGIGFTLSNVALIITGALVGSSGAILSYIMCRGMNRSFVSVILGGFGNEESEATEKRVETRPIKQGGADDAAFILKNARYVIIVPGYGMAVSQAQHALREMVDTLKEKGIKVAYAVHPVAGRMPGHMNVLLAEANVPYDEVFELEEINNDFAKADAAIVIGANDVTNPAAKTDTASPIYGMPVLDVEKASTVLFMKRGMGTGYAGVENELFFRDNTMMLFSDAKSMVEKIIKAL